MSLDINYCFFSVDYKKAELNFSKWFFFLIMGEHKLIQKGKA